MSLDNENKLKNSERPRFQWWLLIAGFWVGVVVAVIVIGSRPQTSQNQNLPGNTENIWLTATALIQESTRQAGAPPSSNSDDLDPIPMTATAIVQEATRQAIESQQAAAAEQDAFMLTATQYILEATQNASSG